MVWSIEKIAKANS